MRNSESPSKLESVDRALQLVTWLRTGEVMSVKSAGERLGVAPSTAHRLLGALVDRDFAVQDRERRYRAGPQLVSRGESHFSVNQLRQAARPALQQLYGDVNDTVQLMVPAGPHVRFIDGIESEAALHVKARMGDLMPAYCSAGGKAMLAELGNVELEQVYRGGLPPWPTARIHALPVLKRQLAAVRKAGYAANLEETEQGVSGLGVCIRDATGKPVAAFTTAIPTARYKKAMLPDHVKALREAASMTESGLLSGGADRP
ncbi:IclR family transcriptional regulator [Arthrobacter sp. PAMC25564]|uniref:IclR family transcriptional regulator n=1 Tax=Arthrobacter sp. PAMC25564 TaxID=2565366 RepID=UPI0010A2437C|nr:IclR family transcriptional regulator [Arthrobacter sp. PAMC25564]QCB97593.1 IclR family transcriptional regulator [Arthrobacter sp. PAMC25564]